MRQAALFDGGLDGALEDAVFALGSWQQSAATLWPTECPIERGRYLRQALDPGRREKLAPAELEALIVAAAAHGCLVPLERLTRLCGCRPPEPVPPEAQEGAATEAVQRATEALQQALSLLSEAQARRVRVVR